jgi:hypothetical protein
MKRFFSLAAKGLFAVVASVMTLWAMAAIYYSNLPWYFLRAAAAIILLAVCLGIFIAIRPFLKAFFHFL